MEISILILYAHFLMFLIKIRYNHLLPLTNADKTKQRQCWQKLTDFLLEGNQRRPAIHRVNDMWLHLKLLLVVCISSRSLEDHIPLWYRGEHLKSAGTG